VFIAIRWERLPTLPLAIRMSSLDRRWRRERNYHNA